MKIDLSVYKSSLGLAKTLLERYPDESASKVSNILCSATMMPQIAAIYLVAHHTGMTDDLNEKLRRIVDFYGYTEVTGQDFKGTDEKQV